MLIGTVIAVEAMSSLEQADLDVAIAKLEAEKREIEKRRDSIVRSLGAVHDEIDAVNEQLAEARVLRATRSPEMSGWTAALAAPVEFS